MKKKRKFNLFIIAAAFFMYGCGTNDEIDRIKSDYQIIIIEGCEYVVMDHYSGYVGHGFMAHKGNCINHAFPFEDNVGTELYSIPNE